jgi:hypothetical protein
MNLHANAALNWSGRRRLCEFVVVEGWTVKAAAAVGGCQRPLRAEVGWPLPPRGRRWSARPLFGAARRD